MSSDPPPDASASVRLFDPSSLDDDEGARAHLAVTIPAEALRAGTVLVIECPPRMQCARCDGGGCDACARRGVLRAPSEVDARIVRTHVVSASGDAVRVRVPHPFRGESEIRQLLLEVHGGVPTSPCVRGVDSAEHERGLSVVSRAGVQRTSALVAMVVAIAAVIATLAALALR